MNEPASTILATRDDFSNDPCISQQSDHPAIADLHRQTRALRSELDEVEPLISAAVLAATAFRLRDNDGLVSALRILVGATRTLEERRACG
ncbi:MAG: hypothetical protein ACREJ0_25450 [Geminicoccaceae bacterium]